MKPIITLFIVAAFLLISGCSSSDSSSKDTAQDAPPPVSHTVFAPYIRDIDKAKNVQKTVDAQKQALDQQIQAQTGATTTSAPAAQTPR
ncbi:MAG: hypothetical protein ACRETA_09270 [Gammaproteobacteria bacterium]